MYNMNIRIFVKYLIVVVFCMSITMELCAQNNASKNVQNTHQFSYEQIAIAKKQFIQNNLYLTKDEATRFWKLYQERENEKRQIRQKYLSKQNNQTSQVVDWEKKSDEEIYQIMDSKINKRKALLDVEVKYYQQMKQLLPAKKLYKFQQLENEYKKQMIEVMKTSSIEK